MTRRGAPPARSAWSRRELLVSAALLGAGLAHCTSPDDAGAREPREPGLDPDDARRLEAELQALLEENSVPGFAAGLIRDSALLWSGGFGHADLDLETPMTPDTLLNIGSVTKTVTTTAVLQLVEQHRLGLDDDVQAYLDFPVRNPRFPDASITPRQLLTHRSSIADGAAYGESYACGDRTRTLRDWLAEYFTAPDLEKHFHTWRPGTVDPPLRPRPYSNVAFGLLGHLIERVSGSLYEDYLRRHILDPLGMTRSGIRIDRIDTARHAVPYSRVGEGLPVDVSDPEFERKTLARFAAEERPPEPGGLHPHCLYSFATPPDGLLRTSIHELGLFLLAWIGKGTAANGGQGGLSLLSRESVDDALSERHFGRALCWERSRSSPGEALWTHSGGDPGIATLVGFRPEERSGVLMMFNVDDPGEMLPSALEALLKALEA